MSRFLIIPKLKIHNANAISSPYTIGFPAMTAWLGAVHALQRFINQQPGFEKIQFKRIAISCHEFDLQTYKGKTDFVSSIIGTSNPLDERGSRPPFIEEARCHLTVSILVEYNGLEIDADTPLRFEHLVNEYLPRMKWAGGDLLSVQPVIRKNIDEQDREKSIKKILHMLMLGYVLIERRDLMIRAMKEDKDALESLLDHMKIMHRSESKDNQISWASKRKAPGWLVPIAVGFQGITSLGKAKNQRDPNVLHRFAESVVTLGEFVMPFRFDELDDILWHYHVDVEKNLYLCRNQTIN